MIPGDSVTTVPLTNLFRAPNNLPYLPLTQTVWGGTAIGNASRGRLVKYWVVNYEAGIISVRPIDGPVVFTLPQSGVTSVSLAFDNNMGLVITYTKSDGAYLYYFNSQTTEYTIRFFPGVTSSRVCVDDARDFYLSSSDVLFVYTLNNRLCYRKQRDRYDVEFFVDNVTKNLIRVGQNVVNRLQFELGVNLVAAPPTPIPPPRIDSIDGELFALTAPIINTITGTDQIIGIPRLDSFYGDVYPLMSPTLVDITGTDVLLSAPRLSSFEGEIYALSTPVIDSIEGEVPLIRPSLVSIEGEAPLTAPVLVSFEGTAVPLSSPTINSIEGTVVVISRPELVSFEGVLAIQPSNQTTTNDMVFTENQPDGADLVFTEPAV
jgi:hypothetical protein